MLAVALFALIVSADAYQPVQNIGVTCNPATSSACNGQQQLTVIAVPPNSPQGQGPLCLTVSCNDGGFAPSLTTCQYMGKFSPNAKCCSKAVSTSACINCKYWTCPDLTTKQPTAPGQNGGCDMTNTDCDPPPNGGTDFPQAPLTSSCTTNC
jgi:hypothetical protein